MTWLAREIQAPAVQASIAEAAALYVNTDGPETGQLYVTLLLDVKDKRVLRVGAQIAAKGKGVRLRSGRRRTLSRS